MSTASLTTDLREGATPAPASACCEPLPAQCCSPLATPGLSAPEAETTAAVLKALSDANRVRIVNLLANSEGPVCVCEITSSLGTSQATTSFHLRKLLQCGLIDRQERGTWAYYSLNVDVLQQLRHVFEVEEAVTT